MRLESSACIAPTPAHAVRATPSRRSIATLWAGIAALIIALVGTPSFAADANGRASASHVAAAKDLLRLLRVQDSVPPMVAQLSLLITEQIQQWNPPEDQKGEVEKTIDKVNEALAGEINWTNLESDYVVLYTETFTEEELKQIARFFRSGAGAKYIASVPGIQQRTLNIGELRMARVQPRIELLMGDLKRHLDVLDLERNPPAAGAPATPVANGGDEG